MSKERKDFAKYFEKLELPMDASLPEVRKSYSLLKELYSRESIVTLPLKDELSEGERKAILSEIEEAHEKLLSLFESESAGEEGHNQVQAQPVAYMSPSEIETFSGAQLRQLRESLGVDLQDVAFATKISVQQLRNIEDEEYEALPPDVYTRGFVVSYAKFLSLDHTRVAEDYMSRYKEWKDFGSRG